jgi:hypothetical protein
MFTELTSQVYLGVVFLTVAFAWWKGERPERIGSLFNAILSIGVVLFQTITNKQYETTPILVGDGLLATGFLILAIRYASLWLAAAMVLQSATFLIHAMLLMGLLPEGRPPYPYYYYYATMNLLGMLVMVSILLGTAGVWCRRHRARVAAARAAAA